MTYPVSPCGATSKCCQLTVVNQNMIVLTNWIIWTVFQKIDFLKFLFSFRIYIIFENKCFFISLTFYVEIYAGEEDSPYPQYSGCPLRSTYAPWKFFGSVDNEPRTRGNLWFLVSCNDTFNVYIIFWRHLFKFRFALWKHNSKYRARWFFKFKGLAIPNGIVHPQDACEMAGKIRVHLQQHSTWICAPSGLHVVPL